MTMYHTSANQKPGLEIWFSLQVHIMLDAILHMWAFIQETDSFSMQEAAIVSLVHCRVIIENILWDLAENERRDFDYEKKENSTGLS